MIVEVHMRDGRTTHMLRRRGDLYELVRRKPEGLAEHRPVNAMTRHHADDAFVPSRLMFLSAASISQVLTADAAAPSDRTGEQRLYLLLALFDTRDDSQLADLVRSAREGSERSHPDMNEADAWVEFDRLWGSYTSEERLALVAAAGRKEVTP